MHNGPKLALADKHEPTADFRNPMRRRWRRDWRRLSSAQRGERISVTRSSEFMTDVEHCDSDNSNLGLETADSFFRLSFLSGQRSKVIVHSDGDWRPCTQISPPISIALHAKRRRRPAQGKPASIVGHFCMGRRVIPDRETRTNSTGKNGTLIAIRRGRAHETIPFDS